VVCDTFNFPKHAIYAEGDYAIVCRGELTLHFWQCDDRSMAKMKIGLAKGKDSADKRDTQKKRDWNRQKQRLLRDLG
jgi:tmRNA-binding protein